MSIRFVLQEALSTSTQAVALASLEPDRLTLSASVLDQLAASTELPETSTPIGGEDSAGDNTNTQSTYIPARPETGTTS